MITTAVVLAFLKKAYEFIKTYKRYILIFLVAVILTVLASRITSCDEKPDTHIVVPNTAIQELQKQKDAELKKVLDDVDERRKAIDGKVVEPKTSGKRNVTAKDLEEVTR